MKILVGKDIERTEWEALVKASAMGTWFQTPEAYDFFATQPELFQPFAYGIEYDGRLRGVCSGYITVEKSAIKQFLTRRAIIIGGPVLADDCTDAEVEVLMSAVREIASLQLPPKRRREKTPSLEGGDGGRLLSPIYIETRNFNDYSRWKGAFAKAGFDYMPHLNFHVDCTDKAKMWERLSENRKRQIKKAIKSGVEIAEAQSEQEIADWFVILQELYTTKVKTPLFPLSFFLEFYRQGLGKFLMVKYEGKVIGGIMCPILSNGERLAVSGERREPRGVIYEWFVCGNDAEYKSQNPSVMATYAAMEHAHAHGLARFDFMGAGKPNEPYGVRDFKARFGGDEVEYGRFLCVTKPMLYKLGTIGVKALKRFRI